MENDPEPVKKKTPASQQGIGQKATPTFEKLSQKDKTFISTQYQLAFDLYTSKQYDKAIYEVTKIFDLIPDYKDSRDILRYAEEGKRRLAAIEAENKKKEEEARIRTRVAELEEEISKLILNKKYDQAAELFPQVTELDPENANIEKWQAQVNDYLVKKKKEEDLKALTARLTEQAKGIKEDADDLLSKKQFRLAVNKYTEAMTLSPVDEKMKAKLKEGREMALQELTDALSPLLEEALSKEKDKDFSAAYKLYEQAGGIDPEDVHPKQGIERIRDTLHMKAKGLYTEGLLFESYSDFEGAKLKYAEAKETAPQDDEYFEKASSKLKKFEVLHLAFPSNPRQPSSAGPPQLRAEDLDPSVQPGVPKETTKGTPSNAVPLEQPPVQAPVPEVVPMPDFSQILQNAGGVSGNEGVAP